MARGQSPDQERLYVLTADREQAPEEQTLWFVKSLPYPVLVEVQDGLMTSEDLGPNQRNRYLIGSREKKILVNGLVRVENFRDQTGATLQVPKGDGPLMHFLSYLRDEWRVELVKAILGESTFTPEETKNSDSRSGLSGPGAAIVATTASVTAA